MRESWRAYKTMLEKTGKKAEPSLPGLAQYSSDQLFFMSYAALWCEAQTFMALVSQLSSDPHPPHVVRVTQVLECLLKTLHTM